MSVFRSLGAGAAGVATHLLFFNHGEHHLYATRYLQALILAFGTSVVALTHYGGHSMNESLNLSSSIFGYFLAGLPFFQSAEQVPWPLLCPTVHV